MSARTLRKRVPISYYEQDEPAFDEYVYCEKCSDFVNEYCSIHGPLLVVPDEKVHGMPSIVPRAALTIPGVFLHIAVSTIPGAGLGVFSTLTLPRGVRFGPYRGNKTEDADSNYCWQIYDKNHKPSHVVDAEDSNNSNWMRYVNCARHWKEQNLLAYQYRGELYYRTIKIIPKHTELLVFYGSRYAHELQIDIAKYNSDKYYNEVIGNQPKYIPTIQTIEVTPYEEIPHETNKDEVNNIVQHYIHDNFQYIEDAPSNEVITLNFDNNNEYFLNNQLRIEENKNEHTKIDLEYKYLEHHSNIIEQFDINRNEQNEKIDTIKLESNIKLENYQNVYECDICFKYKTTNRKNYWRHRLIHGNDKLYKCTFCEYQTNNKNVYYRHISLHTQKYVFRCEKCLYATTSKRYLARHAKDVHKTEKTFYLCKFCPFKSYTDIVMETHIKRHDKKTLKCDFCHYLCEKNRDLKKHINTHTNKERNGNK